MKRRICIILLSLLAFAVGGGYLWLRRLPDQAARMIAGRKLGAARRALKTYLSVFSRDDRARLLLAEAYVLDDSLPSAAEEALAQLGQISNLSPEVAEARFREGQLRFLILHQPAAGEKLLRHSLRVRPDFLPANMLMWRLLEVTGRQSLAEVQFWKVYQLSAPADRPLRLREAYLGEFSPGAASAELDRNWGLLGPDELPGPDSEYRRYEMFMKDEPQAILGYSAAMLWCLRHAKVGQAEKLLSVAFELPDAETQPLYFEALISLFLEKGLFPDAQKAFGVWPHPHAGYEFFKYQGTILDEVQHDIPAAVTAYRTAIKLPTGDAEWTTQNRLAHCLHKLGEHAAAETVQQQAKIVEQLMEPKVHQRIRNGLANLQDPVGLQPVLDLYQALGRERAVDAWKQVIEELQYAHTRR